MLNISWFILRRFSGAMRWPSIPVGKSEHVWTSGIFLVVLKAWGFYNGTKEAMLNFQLSKLVCSAGQTIVCLIHETWRVRGSLSPSKKPFGFGSQDIWPSPLPNDFMIRWYHKMVFRFIVNRLSDRWLRWSEAETDPIPRSIPYSAHPLLSPSLTQLIPYTAHPLLSPSLTLPISYSAHPLLSPSLTQPIPHAAHCIVIKPISFAKRSTLISEALLTR